MNKEVFNNLVVIADILLIFASVGLSIHEFHSYGDVVAGTMYLLATLGFTLGFALGLRKLFDDRANDDR